MQGLAKATEHPRMDTLGSILSDTIHPDIKRTLVGMSKRTGMTVIQVADEVFYTGLSRCRYRMLRDRPHGNTRPFPSK